MVSSRSRRGLNYQMSRRRDHDPRQRGATLVALPRKQSQSRSVYRVGASAGGPTATIGSTQTTAEVTIGTPVEELGWTRDKALEIRAQFASWAEVWDDPDMDVYNDLL